jgi:hypothetical protein
VEGLGRRRAATDAPNRLLQERRNPSPHRFDFDSAKVKSRQIIDP